MKIISFSLLLACIGLAIGWRLEWERCERILGSSGRQKIEELEGKIEVLQRDRDRWKAEAQRLNGLFHLENR